MDRIVVRTKKDLDRICDWVTGYLQAMPSPDTQVEFAPPFDKGEVILEHLECRLPFQYEGEGDVFFRVFSTKSGHEIGSFRFNYGSQNVRDRYYNHKYLPRNVAEEFEQDNQWYLRYAMSWFVLMLFAVYYRPEIERQKKLSAERKPTSRKGKKGHAAKTLYISTYVFDEELLEDLPKTPRKRSKPDHEFDVRGHYRRYKTGKVAWIRPHTRCKGRKPGEGRTYIARVDDEHPMLPSSEIGKA